MRLCMGNSIPGWDFQEQVGSILMVSCLFTKHLLPHNVITIDDTEKLNQSNHRASLAGHYIGSAFFCTSTVCLLIGHIVNEN